MSPADAAAVPAPVHWWLPIREAADVAEAGRAVLAMALAHGFARIQAYYLATAVIELGHNIVAHAAGQGSIELHIDAGPAALALEIIAVDEGPGIADVGLALTDGFSTNGGLGCGLPGVARLLDHLEIDTAAGHGTRIRARKRR